MCSSVMNLSTPFLYVNSQLHAYCSFLLKEKPLQLFSLTVNLWPKRKYCRKIFMKLAKFSTANNLLYTAYKAESCLFDCTNFWRVSISVVLTSYLLKTRCLFYGMMRCIYFKKFCFYFMYLISWCSWIGSYHFAPYKLSIFHGVALPMKPYCANRSDKMLNAHCDSKYATACM